VGVSRLAVCGLSLSGMSAASADLKDTLTYVEGALMGWEWFNTAAGAASLMSLILGAILGVVSWRISKATNTLITSTSAGTQAVLERVTTNTHAVLERMDQRADERQREMVEAMKALRG
jgi:hypothetical protein